MNQTEFSTKLLPMKDKIFRFARSIVSDEAEAEDITQDIFEKLWVKRATLDDCTNLEGFVMSSVRNLCYDRMRNRQMKAGKHESIRNEMPSSAPGLSVDYIDTREIVGRIMECLPDKQRIVLHLRDIEGYEMDAISETTGIDVATARVVLSRARKTVKEELIKIMNHGVR